MTSRRASRAFVVLAVLLALVGLVAPASTARPVAARTSVLMIWTHPHSITSVTQANHYLGGTPLGFRTKMGHFGHNLATSAECGGLGVFVERFDSRGFASSMTSCG